MPEETTTEYAVEVTRQGEDYHVPVREGLEQAQVLVDAYAYDRDNETVRIVTREVTEWVEHIEEGA